VIQDFVVITGFSGAGKSQAMATFEDAGYFCVDNLPPEMIGSLAELFGHEGSKVERAAVASDVEALKLMLSYDPDFAWVPESIQTGPRQPGNTGGKTALMVAMNGGKGVGMAGGPGDIREGIAPPFREVSNRNPIDAVKLLLEAGADPDAKTPDGDTALHLAAFDGKLDIVRTLVEGGADMNVKDAAGKTALQVVSEQKPRPPRPTAGALVDGEMPAQPAEVADLLRGLASGNTQASNGTGSR